MKRLLLRWAILEADERNPWKGFCSAILEAGKHGPWKGFCWAILEADKRVIHGKAFAEPF